MWIGTLRARDERWAGDPDGLHIRHDGNSIPVTVRVQLTDGTEGEVNDWTSQWTRTHVCVVRSLEPGRFPPLWVRVKRREE